MERQSLTGASFLITGGTGSFGQRCARTLIERFNPRRVVVFSRDELKQYEMQHAQPFADHPDQMRFFIGDVRDEARLRKAMEGVEIVIHAAALKQVPACEYNPFEAIKTNIIGAENVINAAIATGVRRVLALSTDKAAAPVNLYGATKLASDKLFIAANNHRGSHEIDFAVVRYGNVMGSRGSVIPFFQSRRASGVLPVTDERMTRFNITLQAGVDFVLSSLQHMWGGELFVPKIPSYRILDVAAAVAPEARVEVVGIRAGEKLHEEMVTATDALSTVEFDDYYVILPQVAKWEASRFIAESHARPGKMCEYGFSYNSGDNPHFLSVDVLRDLIAREIHV